MKIAKRITKNSSDYVELALSPNDMKALAAEIGVKNYRTLCVKLINTGKTFVKWQVSTKKESDKFTRLSQHERNPHFRARKFVKSSKMNNFGTTEAKSWKFDNTNNLLTVYVPKKTNSIKRAA